MNVQYAILQKSLEIPPVDALRRAFTQVRCLTDADAHSLANDAYGILVKNLGADDAATLRGALAREGVETEIVPGQLLPQLPATKYLKQLECGRDVLVIYDPLGRKVSIDWGHVLMVAVGRVKVLEMTRQSVQRSRSVSEQLLRPSLLRGGVGMDAMDRTTEYRNDWVEKAMMEIVLNGGVARYSVEIHDSPKLVFRCLGARQTGDLVEDTRLLLQDMRKAAPRLLLNRGAHAVLHGDKSFALYPSKNAFYEEVIWMLWHVARSQAEGQSEGS